MGIAAAMGGYFHSTGEGTMSPGQRSRVIMSRETAINAADAMKSARRMQF